jgi:hypothetical protein
MLSGAFRSQINIFSRKRDKKNGISVKIGFPTRGLVLSFNFPWGEKE